MDKNYRILAVLSDIDNLKVKKVPKDLFEEMELYLKQKFNPHGISISFQKLYDNLCQDKEKQDKKMVEFWNKLEDCETINCDLIQVY